MPAPGLTAMVVGSAAAALASYDPSGQTGSIASAFARFRLSTDAAFVADPTSTGLASDGEVEDYRRITWRHWCPPTDVPGDPGDPGDLYQRHR